jgi:hypothetical protein
MFMLAALLLGCGLFCRHYKKQHGQWPWERLFDPQDSQQMQVYTPNDLVTQMLPMASQAIPVAHPVPSLEGNDLPVALPVPQAAAPCPAPISQADAEAILYRLGRDVGEACHGGITAHLAQLEIAKEKQALQLGLQLMHPSHYRQFAAHALSGTAAVTVQAMHFNLRLHPASGALPPPVDAQAQVERHLAAHLQPFDAALANYSAAYEAFIAHQEGIYGRGFAYGQDYARVGAEIGSRFGFWGTVAGLAAGTLWGGKVLCGEIDALANRTDQTFQAMLSAYEQSMDAMLAGLQAIVNQHEEYVQRLAQRQLTNAAALI